LRNDARSPPISPNPIDQNTCKQLLQPDPSKTANDFLSVNGIPFYET